MNPLELPWRPTAELSTLRLRARLLSRIRGYFADTGVLEVETPCLSRSANSDPAIASLAVPDYGWLHTSPEFAMKRLLAAGSGSIYQMTKVYRGGEQGRLHNPEFTLLEWYRVGFDHHALMGEVARLAAMLIPGLDPNPVQLSYADAFRQYLGLDPFVVGLEELRAAAVTVAGEVVGLGDERDAWLDLLFSLAVQPRLPSPCFVVDYPASQAALARLSADDPRIAERFEFFVGGVELANGYHELSDVDELTGRLAEEQRRRLAAGLPQNPTDPYLLAALRAGLPACAGVALGVDRLVMLAGGHEHIDQVLTFPWTRA